MHTSAGGPPNLVRRIILLFEEGVVGYASCVSSAAAATADLVVVVE